jgi:lipopolysaccharide export system permease protein
MILKAFIGPWVMSLFIILFILVIQLLAAYLPEIAGKGLGLAVIGKMFYYASGRLMMQAMPVAILAGALMTVGGMGERNELAAIKSSGISLPRMAMPLGFMGIFIAAFMLWFSFELVPVSALKFYSLLYDVGRKKAELTLKPGHFYGGIDEYVIRVADKDPERNTLYDVLIYNHSKRSEGIDVIAADSARTVRNEQSQLRMVLYAGVRHEEMSSSGKNSGKKNHGRTYFDSLYYKFNLQGFELNRTDEKLFSNHYMTLKQRDLSTALDSLKGLKNKSIRTFQNYISPYTKLDSTYSSKLIRDSLRAHASSEKRNPYKKPKDTTTLITPKEETRGKKRINQLRPRRFAPDTGKLSEEDLEVMASLPGMPSNIKDSANIPLRGSIVDRYPDINRTEVISKALGSARSVKNYAEFMIGKRADQAKRKRRYTYEHQHRWAAPCLCLVFMIIGISLGAIIRKGGMGVPGIISVVVLILSYIVQNQGKDMARDGVLNPIISAWLPILIFGPLGLWLLYLAAMEAQVLDEESRGKLFGRLWRWVGKFVSGIVPNRSAST